MVYHVPYRSPSSTSNQITEGWLEIDKHYSLELCFSIVTESLSGRQRHAGYCPTVVTAARQCASLATTVPLWTVNRATISDAAIDVWQTTSVTQHTPIMALISVTRRSAILQIA